MPATLPLLGAARPRKSVDVQGESRIAAGEPDRKPFAEYAPQLGRAIERALVLANLTKQDAAWRMGYQDASALSRWISGVETPQFARLFGLPELRSALVIALAELAEDVEVTTTIQIRRTR